MMGVLLLIKALPVPEMHVEEGSISWKINQKVHDDWHSEPDRWISLEDQHSQSSAMITQGQPSILYIIHELIKWYTVRGENKNITRLGWMEDRKQLTGAREGGLTRWITGLGEGKEEWGHDEGEETEDSDTPGWSEELAQTESVCSAGWPFSVQHSESEPQFCPQIILRPGVTIL